VPLPAAVNLTAFPSSAKCLSSMPDLHQPPSRRRRTPWCWRFQGSVSETSTVCQSIRTTAAVADGRSAATLFRRENHLLPAASDLRRNHLVLIDVQRDFCFPEGTLYVGGRSGQGALDDNDRIARFIYRNLARISEITCTLDSHLPFQIFFTPFWVDAAGEPLTPHRTISDTRASMAGMTWLRPMFAVLHCRTSLADNPDPQPRLGEVDGSGDIGFGAVTSGTDLLRGDEAQGLYLKDASACCVSQSEHTFLFADKQGRAARSEKNTWFATLGTPSPARIVG